MHYIQLIRYLVGGVSMDFVLPAGCQACIAIRLLSGELRLADLEGGVYPVNCFEEGGGSTTRAVEISVGGHHGFPPRERQVGVRLAEIMSVGLDAGVKPREGVSVVSNECTSHKAEIGSIVGRCKAGVVSADGNEESLPRLRSHWNS